MKRHKGLKAAVIGLISLFALSAKAQLDLGLDAPNTYLAPGEKFRVKFLFINSGTAVRLGRYQVKVAYDRNVIKPVQAVGGELSVFKAPASEDLSYYDYLELVDNNTQGAECQPIDKGSYSLAEIEFEVIKGAPYQIDRVLSILDDAKIWDCQGQDLTKQLDPPPFQDDIIRLVPYVEQTYHLEQYLDLDADWKISEKDVDELWDLLLRKKYNTSGETQVKIGGLQMDLTGNNKRDYYDHGWADAVARPTRFIHSGANGLCQSSKSGDDVQQIAVNQGSPNTIAILPGANNVLNTTPSGDDYISGMVILAGANGVCESQAQGDDLQNIVLGYGEADKICIAPGTNGYLDSSVGGDDQSFSMDKDSGAILTQYQPSGAPVSLEMIYPPTSPFTLRVDKVEGWVEIPVLIRVLDNRGMPLSGVAPDFTVVKGEGWFVIGSKGQKEFKGQPANQFVPLANVPEGMIGCLFHAVRGANSIEVLLEEDPAKGINKQIKVFFSIDVIEYDHPHPRDLTLKASTDKTKLGSPVVLDLNIKGPDGPMEGVANRILLLSNRSLEGGMPDSLERESRDRIFFDDFEQGLELWTVNPGEGTIGAKDYLASWLGSMEVMVTGARDFTGYIQRLVQNTGNYDQLFVSYQWAYTGGGASHIFLQASPNGKTWQTLHELTGEDLLASNGNWLWHRKEFQPGFGASADLYLRFYFNMRANDKFYLDHVNLAGFKRLFYENFETLSPNEYPATMDWSYYINSGPDGILQTKPDGDDQLLFESGGGLPNQLCILPGPNKVLNSEPGGDDLVQDKVEINTGNNGICESKAKGDDFQLIPFGEGKAFTIGITPGKDQVLETKNDYDDELVSQLGKLTQDQQAWTIRQECAGASQQCLRIGRTKEGSVQAYGTSKIVNLGGAIYAYLSFYSKNTGLTDATDPLQEWLVEVSDDGGKTFVPVWDFNQQEEKQWTYHLISLNNDHRFHLVDNFIIQFRATMNQDLGHDQVLIDNIQVFAGGEKKEKFTPLVEIGEGNYQAIYYPLSEGIIELAAVYYPENFKPETEVYPFPSNPVTLEVLPIQVNPSTVRIYPQDFQVKACQRMNYLVIGKQVGQNRYTDLTNLFRLDIHGPARMIEPGIMEIECFGGSTPENLYILTIPEVPSLTDPEGGGTGIQTGVVSGRIFKPNLAGAGDAAVQVKIDANNKIYGKTDADGFYMFSGVPAGSGYSVIAIKSGYTKTKKDSVNLSAGANKTVDLVLDSGNDCDGDGTLDGADTDDDNEGFSDAQENAAGTNKCNWDSDGDGVADNVDEFPANPSESLDTDNDGTGDNEDTDDDNDGLSDTEETTIGLDGYITDPLDPDTDDGGKSDGQEDIDNTDPTDPADDAVADTDGDGLPNSIETGLGNCAYAWTQMDTGSLYNDLDKDSDNDGLLDYAEVKTHGTNPMCVDTDADKQYDYKELSNYSSCNCVCMNPLNPDTDGDGRNDGAEDADHDNVLDASETDPCNPDTDGDGLPDGWEVTYGLNPRLDDDHLDSDTDGLNNMTEYLAGTYPNDSDSDDDTMKDGWEYQYQPYTDPLNGSVPGAANNPDNDGLTNYQESLAGTDPQLWDTDGDLMPDGWEVNNGLDPLDSNADDDPDTDGLTNLEEYTYGTYPLDEDSDDDGLEDGPDYAWGCGGQMDPDADNDTILDGDEDTDHDDILDAGESSPCLTDTDSDLIGDVIEVPGCSNPNSTDSDGDLIPDNLEDLNLDGDYDSPSETNLCSDQTDSDGIADGVEDANHNGVKDPTETDPRLTDTDGDGIGDGIEVPGCSDPLLMDSDYDGLDDGIEDVNLNGYQDGLETNLCNANSDSDLWNFQDGWEVLYGFDPLDPDDPDGTLDLDSDGLTNNEEALNNTNPFNPDTDGDAMPDGWEVDNLLAPTDPADAYDDLEPDGRRNLDEYKRGFNPRLAEPCGNDKYGRWCFGESNGNGIWDSPDLIALKQLAVGVPGNFPDTLPHSGDALDLNGNGVFDAPDIISMKQLMVGAYSGYLSDGDTLHLESEAALDMEVGDWGEISVTLRSTWNVTRSGVGVVFYFESGSDKGELWGGDGSAVPAGSPPEGFPAGSRYCITDAKASGGKATIWFKATAYAGEVVLKAAVPASALRRSNSLGPNASVTINIIGSP